MAINFGKNVFYEGALPNFERDRYSSLSEMQKAGNEGRLDEGHICYVVAEGQHFVWRGAGLGCLPLESESSGGGSSSGGTVAYRGGAGIDVSGNYISFKYGTALYPHEQDKTIGLQYDEWYFTINEPSEATHRTGLSLRLSTNGGIESVTYGEIQGISVKHDETMEIVKNKLGVKLGNGLRVGALGGLEINPYAVLSADSLNGSPFYQDSDSILRMRLADKVYNDSRYANPLKMTEASMNGNVLTPGGLTLNIGPGLYTYNGKLALQYSSKLFYINEGGYLDIHLDALKAALNGEIVG